MKVFQLLSRLFVGATLLLLLFFLAVALNPDFFVEQMAEYLVIENDPVPSDLIIVISGDFSDYRVNEGFRLLEEGYGEEIIFSGYVWYQTELKKILEEKGLHKDDFYFDDRPESTYENAVYAKEYVEAKDISSFLVVCVPPQSRRARLAFEKVFGDEVSYRIVYPDDYPYEPDKIMTHKVTREKFTNEFVKLAYYMVKYKF